jgi:hypothetical protein
MNKIRPTNISIQNILNNYLLTITYRFGNNYSVKTFAFTNLWLMLHEYDRLLGKYPYLARQAINVE